MSITQGEGCASGPGGVGSLLSQGADAGGLLGKTVLSSSHQDRQAWTRLSSEDLCHRKLCFPGSTCVPLFRALLIETGQPVLISLILEGPCL